MTESPAPPIATDSVAALLKSLRSGNNPPELIEHIEEQLRGPASRAALLEILLVQISINSATADAVISLASGSPDEIHRAASVLVDRLRDQVNQTGPLISALITGKDSGALLRSPDGEEGQ